MYLARLFFLALNLVFWLSSPLRLEANPLPPITWIPTLDDHYLCGGFYQEPPYPAELIALSPQAQAKLPIILSANESTVASHDHSTLSGEVSIQQGNRSLRADQVILTQHTNTHGLQSLSLHGHIRFTGPGLQIMAEEAQTEDALQRIALQNTSYIMLPNQAHGTASLITLDPDHQHITLQNARYSTCAPTHPTWKIGAQHITLNQKTGRGHATHARLMLQEIPVLYLPYLNFPLDKRRQSGFLYPSVGYTNLSGKNIEVPYYWNIAPNYDATLTPNLIQYRGLQLQTLFRYLSPQSEGQFQASLLPADHLYHIFRQEALQNYATYGFSSADPRVLALNRGDNRTALAWTHRSRWSDHWRGALNYNWVSDDNYFIDLSNNIQSSSSAQLAQEATLYRDDRYWHSFFKVQEFQTLHPFSGPQNQDVYRRQPQWGFEASDPDHFGALQPYLQAEWTLFAHKSDPLTQQIFTHGQRFHVQPALELPLHRSYGYVKPRITLDYTHYAVQRGSVDTALHRGSYLSRLLPLNTLDAGLYFDRALYLRNTPFTQTLEPRLYYLYVPYLNQNAYPNFDSGLMEFGFPQLFRTNRFSGIDRIGDAHQISLSTTSRFLNTQHQEKLRLRLGQLLYLNHRRVSLCDDDATPGCHLREDPAANYRYSPLVSEATYHLNATWHLTGTQLWEPFYERPGKSSLNLSYRGTDNRLFNLGYQYLYRDLSQLNLTQDTAPVHLQQTDLSVAWPLSTQWRGLARWHYDLVQQQPIDIFGGFEYNSCCTALQFLASRYLRGVGDTHQGQYAKAFFLTFLFKGLSTLSMNPAASSLSEAIPGFRSFANTTLMRPPE